MNNLSRVVVWLFLVAVTAVPLFTQSAFAQSTDVAITIEASIDQQAPADRIAVGQSVLYLVEWAGTPPLQQGIDVGVDGPTPQRADDTDVPNAPVLFGAAYDAARNVTVVRGRIDSEAHGNGGPTSGTGRNIEIYASLRLSGWSTPQAERSMAIASIDSGHQDFEIAVPGDLRGMWITATFNVAHFLGLVKGNTRGPGAETHRELFPGDTSELSNAVTVQ